MHLMPTKHLQHSTSVRERHSLWILQWTVRHSFHCGLLDAHAVSVLSRVQAFLPALEASNSQLLQQAKDDPRSVDIEHIDDSVQQHIEMVRRATLSQ